MTRRARFLSSVSFPACVLLVAAMPVRADSLPPVALRQPLPAVSTTNGRVGMINGAWPESMVNGMAGSLAIPLGVSFGLQLDGQAGTSDTQAAKGLAQHLFWRDPAHGLFGFYHSQSDATYTGGFTVNADHASVQIFGLESELYLDRLTLKGVVASQSGRYDGTAARASVAYYATDNMKFDLTWNRIAGLNTQTSVGFEWAPFSSTAVTLLARATVGDNHDVRGVGGIAFAFGADDKSMIRRHREDAINSDLPQNLFEAIGDGLCPIGAHHRQGFCDGNI